MNKDYILMPTATEKVKLIRNAKANILYRKTLYKNFSKHPEWWMNDISGGKMVGKILELSLRISKPSETSNIDLTSLTLACEDFLTAISDIDNDSFQKFNEKRMEYSTRGQLVKIKNGCVYLPKVGWVEIDELSKNFKAEKLKRVTIFSEKGQWHLIINF